MKDKYFTTFNIRGKLFIMAVSQRYIVHLYHIYILYTELDRIGALISQHLYWTKMGKNIYLKAHVVTDYKIQNSQMETW